MFRDWEGDVEEFKEIEAMLDGSVMGMSEWMAVSDNS